MAALFAALRQSRIALRQAEIAQRESQRQQLARRVDHEVSRRRECIEALGNLWGAITGMEMDSTDWTGGVGSETWKGQAEVV